MTEVVFNTIGKQTVIITRFDLYASFVDPLFPEKTVKFRTKLKLVNGHSRVLNDIDYAIMGHLSNIYSRRIGPGWKTSNASDAWPDGPILNGKAAAEKNQLAEHRNKLVVATAKEVAKEIQKAVKAHSRTKQ